MYFPTAVALAALPFLVGAVPTQNSLRDAISIPLLKRSKFNNADGFVDGEASIHHIKAFVLPVLFTEKGGSLTRCLLRKYQRGFEAFERNTGSSHPLASELEHLDKRDTTVSDPLDHSGMKWFGSIQ